MQLYADMFMKVSDRPDQLEIIYEAARALEQADFAGSLLFYRHDTLDPWIVAASTLLATSRHLPIIALQPYTMPPLTAANMIHSMAHLYGRKVAINLIPGQSREEQRQVLNPVLPEERFDQLLEYAEVLRLLLTTSEPVTYSGKYYQYDNLLSHTKVHSELQPVLFIPVLPGQFRETALNVVDVAVQQAAPISRFQESFGMYFDSRIELGCRLGVIARSSRNEALQAARESVELRYLQILKKQLHREGEYTDEDMEIYYPTQKGFETRGPLLIGSYDEVAGYLQKYKNAGVKHMIFSTIYTIEEMKHVQLALDKIS